MAACRTFDCSPRSNESRLRIAPPGDIVRNLNSLALMTRYLSQAQTMFEFGRLGDAKWIELRLRSVEEFSQRAMPTTWLEIGLFETPASFSSTGLDRAHR